jgi:hypothetical protein
VMFFGWAIAIAVPRTNKTARQNFIGGAFSKYKIPFSNSMTRDRTRMCTRLSSIIGLANLLSLLFALTQKLTCLYRQAGKKVKNG